MIDNAQYIHCFLIAGWLVIIGVVVAVGAVLLVCAAVTKRKRYVLHDHSILICLCRQATLFGQRSYDIYIPHSNPSVWMVSFNI